MSSADRLLDHKINMGVESKPKWSTAKRIALIILVIAILGLIAAAIAIGISSRNRDAGFQKTIQADAILDHLKKFEEIAQKEENHNSRAVMLGYDDSVKYVMETLAAHTSCKIEREYYKVPVFTLHSQPKLRISSPVDVAMQYGVDFSHGRYGGNGTFELSDYTVEYIPNSGCEDTDFTNFDGNICLLEYNPKKCPIITGALNCENAGAEGLLFYNLPERRALGGWVRNDSYFEGDPLVTIPCLSISNTAGNLLRNLENPKIALELNASVVITETSNVYCITKEGDPKNTIIAGAHLDSVPEGPGINDNGSGSASILEIIIQWYKNKVNPVNRVIFGFWGAEEIGLLGSRYYAKNLQTTDPDEFKNIALALNFDMLGSPNYVPFVNVYDPAFKLPEDIKNGSDVISNAFKSYFDGIGAQYEDSPMNGGSDYFSFAERGIPAGGLVTGASGLKTMEQRTKFGGFANAAHDPCYHLACDTVENINKEGLQLMSRAAAATIYDFALTKDVRKRLAKP